MPASDHAHDDLRRIIADAARFLPPQGPIDSFVAQNTLQGFEAHPFEEAVVRAARLYDAQPFLPESTYRAELAHGRITVADLDAVLTRELGDQASRPLLDGRTTRGALERVLLLHAVRHESDDAVRWTLAESDALRRLRTDLAPAARQRLLAGAASGAAPVGRTAAAEQHVAAELWHACVAATALSRPAVVHVPPPVRHRELILAADPALDTDALVHPLLIRLVAAFLDQGVAAWPMPDRDRGLLASVAGLYAAGPGPLEPWSLPLGARFRTIAARSSAGGDDLALDVIATELAALGVPEASRSEFVAASLVALRGWAAMVHQLELRPDRTPVRRLPARLADFLALRLLLDRAAVTWAAQRLAGARPDERGTPHLAAWWMELRDRCPPRRGPGTLARAFLLHQVAQLLGLGAADLQVAGENDILALEHAIAAFDSVARRRLFHLAYERRHAITVLDGLAAQPAVAAAGNPPRVQAIFCIDERCESLRRHLEETSPGVETFGTAGFFAVPMYYRGIDDWHTVPLCPIVMRPAHTVHEVPDDADARSRQRFRQTLRRAFGRLQGGASSGSRTPLRGGLLTSIGGAVAALPLVARVAAPRLTSLLERRAADFGRRRIRTRLELEHTGAPPLPDGTQAGFAVAEMAGMVRRLLEDIGLTAGFARLVAVVGHGSTSLNNPHESAYDCGACGGGRGGPNARAFALMANHPAVRAALAAAGLVIPADTVFVGGMQDTCTSQLRWFDADRIPAGHAAEFAELRAACRRAGQDDAQERCRRFASVPLDVSPAEAKRAVEGRAADLAQVRPEYGHASNAVCIVGRRARTRGLFLDRRAFLVSYDPAADTDGRILERTLAAVGPVAGGINLAYLFSRVDPLGYGAGTKLPHNITGLIGVMDGHAGDLRTGLPVQGVEIHEPVRLLMVVEARPTRILEVLERLPPVRTLMVNGWIRLVAWDPESGRLLLHDPTHAAGFVPYQPESRTIPVVERSADWYRGHRGHLPPARLLAGTPRSLTSAESSA